MSAASTSTSKELRHAASTSHDAPPGRSSRSSGVVTGATARLAHARLAQGDLDTAQALASEALASTSETFMPVISGYAFRSAGLVNVELGHVAPGRELLQQAIAAFERGTGNLGAGLAALCRIDLSRSFRGDDEIDDARRSALTAIELARVSGDPWVLRQAEQHLQGIGPSTEQG